MIGIALSIVATSCSGGSSPVPRSLKVPMATPAPTTSSTAAPTTVPTTALAVPTTTIAVLPSTSPAPIPSYNETPGAPVVTSLATTAGGCIVNWVNAVQDTTHGTPLGADIYVDGTKLNYVQWWSPTLTTPVTTYTVTGLAPGSHTLEIDNFNSAGEGPMSVMKSFTLVG